MRLEELDDTRSILGYQARALVIYFEDGSQTTFWSSPDLRVDPDWFSELRLAGLHMFYEAAEALYLDYIRETDTQRRRYVATDVTHRQVAAEELALPDLPVRAADFDNPN